MSYEYVNARIRAMRGDLISAAALQELVRLKDFQTFADHLSSLPGYGEALASSATRFQGLESVEWALKEALSAVARRIRMMAHLSGEGSKSSSTFFWDKEKQYLAKQEGESQTIGALIDTLIQRWDLFNVKTILRSKHAKSDPRELDLSLIPVGKLSQAHLQSLAGAKDVKEVCDFLITWEVDFARPLREGLKAYLENKNLLYTELYLDRYYFERGLHVALGENSGGEGALRQTLEYEIDQANLLTLLRAHQAGANGTTASFFILGGRLSLSFLKSLLSEKKPEDIFERLIGTPYQEVIQGALTLYIQKGDLASVEKKFEELLLRRALRLYLRDPLGLGVLIGYLWMKVAEVTNLKMIANGLFYKMPGHLIRERLTKVEL